MFISFIFPCYNEELSISKFLPAIIQTKKALMEMPQVTQIEILIVNDGSTDQSLELLKNCEEEITIISLKTRKGYGEAIKEGIQKSKGDWVAFCDLDNTCTPEDIIKLIKLALGKSLAVVWGNRLHKQSRMFFIRRMGNRLYQFLFFLLSFRFVPDPCSGFRLFKRSVLTPEIYEFPGDLSFSLALTAHCVRYNIPFSSAGIEYKYRLGKSKLHLLKDGCKFFFTLIYFLFFKKFCKEKQK